jgi:methanethiol S-methyltransferase
MKLLFSNDYLILILLWISWCVLHSVMITPSVTQYLKTRFGKTYRFYRLFFNIISVLTLLPVLWYSYSINTEHVFQWTGLLIVVQLITVIISLYLFYAGSKHYDGLQFMGIRQINQENPHNLISESGELDTKDILCVTRHPWYLGSIMIIWARNLHTEAIVINVILTAYLIFGTILEERKLSSEFGDQYRDYQKRVSMLFPFKWAFRIFKNNV